MNKLYLYTLFLLLTNLENTINTSSVFLPPPTNDDCMNAAEIIILNQGFAYGTFTSETADLTEATIQIGEHFEFTNTPNLSDKSVWFSFYLPTSRHVNLDLLIVGGTSSQNLGYTTYYNANCLPTSADLSTKLNPLSTNASNFNPCLDVGFYLIQVHAKANFNEAIFFELTINPPNFDNNESIHDLPENAYSFGLVDDENDFNDYSHLLKCHSIDSPIEYDCLPVTDPDNFLQSIWYTFTTDDYVDFVHIYINELLSGSPLNGGIGYRLFEGDASMSTPINLPIITDCTMLDERDQSYHYYEHICELLPNTTYSFELLFRSEVEIDEIKVHVGHKGNLSTNAPRPLQNIINPTSNQLGILSSSPMGITTTLVDNFSCNAFLENNVCGTVNPATGVFISETNFTYDMSTWVSFELDSYANVRFDYSFNSSIIQNKPYNRLFSTSVTNDCAAIDPIADLYGEFEEDGFFPCMPPGKYSLQILGVSQYPIDPNNPAFPIWYRGLLGNEIELDFIVTSTLVDNNFSLAQPSLIDDINNFLPFDYNILYPALPDTLGCNNTVIPDCGSCTNRLKASYDKWKIGAITGDVQFGSGGVFITNLLTDGFFTDNNFHYKILEGDVSILPVINNTIQGTTDYLDFCIEENNTFTGIDDFFICVSPGDYTTVTFGHESAANLIDEGRTYQLINYYPQFYTRTLAENLGDITNESSILSTEDVYSCMDNEEIIGGVAPCNGATKIHYRQFFLSEPKTITISTPPGAVGNLSLFQGQATDLNTTLSLYEDPNGAPWSCFQSRSTSDCSTIPAGWYTVVAYGYGPGYTHPVWDGLGNTADIGKNSQISIQLADPIISKYDRPFKAYDAGLTDWNVNAQDGICPQTANTYTLGTETFCQADTPFSDRPIIGCDSEYTQLAYYVFTISETSFISFEAIPEQYKTKVYRLDARVDSTLMATDQQLIYPCTNTDFRQLCGLPAGTYTLVVFATEDAVGESITPIIYVDKYAISLHDFAINAYDFGCIPDNGVAIDGRLGDIHPLDPNLPPSHDVIYCSTGAALSDPGFDESSNVNAWSICGDLRFNPNIYNPVVDYVLYLDDVPMPNFSGQRPAVRNLWYTLVLEGTGTATISLNCPGPWPKMKLYESDVDGSLPFTTVVTDGLVDSTEIDGLTWVAANYDFCSQDDGEQSLVFEKGGCLRDSVRYYLMVTGLENKPNTPVSISISYEEEPFFLVKYDHYSNANLINGLEQVDPPYQNINLNNGVYLGAPFSMQCATRGIGDPLSNSNYDRSVWYKFTTETSGIIRLAYEENFPPFERIGLVGSNSRRMQLYYEAIPGDSTSLVHVETTFFPSSNNNNTTGHHWRQACYQPGTYYVFLTNFNDLDNSEYLLDKTYKPLIWLDQRPGDFCNDPAFISISGEGSQSATLEINCHSIGEGFGEDGSNMGCLPGPEGYKSSWFKINLIGNEKYDVSFSLNEMTNIVLSNFSYRLLYGECQDLLVATCVESGDTGFTLSCMDERDYFVQIISPAPTTGTVSVEVTSTLSPDQNCIGLPGIPPVSNFTYTSDCDSIYFENTSSVGDQISYNWSFSNGIPSSLEINPVISIPNINSLDVTLVVTNTDNLLSSTEIRSIPIINLENELNLEDTTICNGGSIFYDFTSPTIDTYLWNDGTTQPTNNITVSGTYWLEITNGNCTVVDTFEVLTTPCNIYDTLIINLCSGNIYQGETYTSDTLLQDTFSINAIVDSILTTEILVTDFIFNQLNVELCSGETFNWNGMSFDQDQMICDTFPTSSCDSIVCVDLNFLDTTIFLQNILLCEGECFSIGDSLYCSQGVFNNSIVSPNGCEELTITTIEVEVIPLLEIQGNNLLCEGASTFLEASAPNDFEQYLWMPGNINASSLEVTTPGIYTLTGITANGCEARSSITVTTSDLTLTLDITEGIDCLTDEATITSLVTGGQAPYQYLWSNSTQDQNLINVPEGNYSLTVTDSFNCEKIESVNIFSNLNLNITTQVQDVLCPNDENGEVIISIEEGTPPYLYSLDGISSFDSVFSNLSSGTYDIIVEDGNGCLSNETITISEPIVFLDLSTDTEINTIQLGDSIQLNARTNAEIDSFYWTINNTTSIVLGLDPFVQPFEETEYTLNIIDQDGCKLNASVLLNTTKENCIYIPSAFSPNADGLNDHFQIRTGNCVKEILEFKVFNRWGALIYSTENYVLNQREEGWDGSYLGQPLNPGVFVWTVMVMYQDGTFDSLSGDVTLIK